MAQMSGSNLEEYNTTIFEEISEELLWNAIDHNYYTASSSSTNNQHIQQVNSSLSAELWNEMNKNTTTTSNFPIIQQEDNSISHTETSFFGLRLTPTAHFCNLAELIRSRARAENCSIGENPTTNNLVSRTTSEKIRATSFFISSLRIGTWEAVSQCEIDLVGKCYYAKKKIVWEVLTGDLKNKIEIKFSEIDAFRVVIRDNEPGILEIELNQPPEFCTEAPPQPGKHTSWNSNGKDITGGSAVLCRRHYVRCAPGVLDKHYKFLLQSDRRLLELSRKPFPRHQDPYFTVNINAIDNTNISSQCNFYGSHVHPSIQHCYTTVHTHIHQPHSYIGTSSSIPVPLGQSVSGYLPYNEDLINHSPNRNHIGNNHENLMSTEGHTQCLISPPIVATMPVDLAQSIGVQQYGATQGIYDPNVSIFLSEKNSTYPFLEQSVGKSQQNFGMNQALMKTRFGVEPKLPSVNGILRYPQYI